MADCARPSWALISVAGESLFQAFWLKMARALGLPPGGYTPLPQDAYAKKEE